MQSASQSPAVLDQTSGATISIAVHKTGPVSEWFGHNLLLRVRQFVLRRTQINSYQPVASSSSSASNTAADNNKNTKMMMNMQEMLAYCCNSVDSASFDPLSLYVAGSVPEKFCPPHFLSSTTTNASGTTQAQEKQNITAVASLPCSESFPALFRWPHTPMSESDCKIILSQTNGANGLLSLKEEGKRHIVPAINFQKTSAQTEHLPFFIRGNLTLVGNTHEVVCGAFLTTNATEKDLSVVFQCPVETEKFGVPTASFLGLLNTESEVLVEVAVPVHQFGL